MEIDQLVQTYLSNEETYESGEIIIEEGTRGDWVYIILEGQVKVTKRSEAGIITIDTLKKGDVFGEMILFLKGQAERTASVTATNGAVRVGALDLQRLLQDYESISPVLKSLISALIRRLKETNDRAAALVVAANQKGRGVK